MSNAVSAQLGGGLMWLWSLRDTRNSKVSEATVPSASSCRLPDLQAAMFVKRLRGWIALPTDRAAACVGSQQWSCLWSRPSVGPGSTSPWATTAVDWKLVMEGPALKERADKNWGVDGNQGKVVNRRHRQWRPWSSLRKEFLSLWRQRVINWRVLMTLTPLNCWMFFEGILQMTLPGNKDYL